MQTKKRNIAKQNERLQLMKSLAHNAKVLGNVPLSELAAHAESSNSKVSDDGIQESNEYEQEDFNDHIESANFKPPTTF